MKTASVIITTKNRKEELLKAVESAMSQHGLLEVVVIDDGSIDGTAEAVLEMLKSRNAEPVPAELAGKTAIGSPEGKMSGSERVKS